MVGGSRKAGFVRALIALATVTVGLAIPNAGAAVDCGAWSSHYVRDENQHTGSTGWRDAEAVTSTSAQVWLDHDSVGCGGTVGVHVASSGEVTISVWRLGWYGGAGGRKMAGYTAMPSILIPPGWPWPQVAASGGGTPAALPPQTSAPTSLASADGAPPPADTLPTYASASAANWPTALSIDITPDFTPGVYVVLAQGPDGKATAAPLVVRDDAGPHALTVIEPTLTWQAYNKWGGANLYQYPAADGTVSGDAQADVVTLDRPFVSLTAGNQLFQQDLGLIQLGERDALDVDYIADEDLESPTVPMMQTHALVMSRHDEYWSAGMRAIANKMVLDGVNLLDLGGNNMYHAGRFLDPGRRWYQVRKRHNTLHAHDAAADISYRFVDSPQDDPQARLLGENFNCISAWLPYRVTDPHFWAWSSEHVRAGQSFSNLVGSESDGPSAGYPAGTVFPSLSPIWCSNAHRDALAGTSYRVVGAARAGVVDMGSLNWLCNLEGVATCPGYRLTSTAGRRFVTHTTETLLREAAHGPLGLRHPARRVSNPRSRPAYDSSVA